jgi:MraZ protein
MSSPHALVRGEAMCGLDERSRISLPKPLSDIASTWQGDCWLVKERPGALSLWPPGAKEEDDLEKMVGLVEGKLGLGRFRERTEELMVLGRLLSTRRTTAKVDGRARVVVPREFREFLGVEPGGQVMVVGAAVCIEIWRPNAWVAFVEDNIPRFRQLFEQLAG